ncbi:hypothetical protein VNO77_39292 [Canavalia gladiata]|uniref:Uncharacterized protein n=1 Tax=Canavalia gladiata TaxID=3824 RepID=A0AAN9KD57_CANGL
MGGTDSGLGSLPLPPIVVPGSDLAKVHNDQCILRVALQDPYQSKSEASPLVMNGSERNIKLQLLGRNSRR